MKHAILAIFLIPMGLGSACGTKKHERHMPASEIETTGGPVNSVDSTKDSDCPAGSECDPTAVEAGHLRVMVQNSLLNPSFDADGTLQNHEGVCLEKFTAGAADAKGVGRLDLSLANMDLKNGRVRCRVRLELNYKKGYAFAIRKVEIPLKARIPSDAEAVFEGSYGFKGRNNLLVVKNLESRYSEKPLRLDHTVADQDIVWSGCSGQATLMVDTGMSLNSSGSEPDGDIRVTGETPYRLEVIWSKCL